MVSKNKFLTNDYSRVFFLDGRAGPATVPTYMGLARAGAPTNDRGDVTIIRNPSPNRYGAFDVVGKQKGAPGNPELPLMVRYSTDYSRMLKAANKDCDHDIQVHIGYCQNPQDFNRGWDKIVVLEGASITSWRAGELGALSPDERAVINEEVPFAGEELYEILKLAFAQKAGTEVTREVTAVVICDSPTCGLCGLPSDGCQVVFAAQKSSGGGSPGLYATLIYTKNGGATWAADTITTFTSAQDPTDAVCVGVNIVIIDGAAAELHYKAISDIVNGVAGSWTEVTTGFSASGLPRRLWAASPSDVWFVGTGGYIYHSSDIASGVSVQDAGVATSQQLNDVHGIDALNVIAVGNSNAVVVTANGGETWRAVTGPAVGVNLNAVYMVDDLRWFVGTAGGRLYYTTDGGNTWVEKAFPGSGSGVIYDIDFSTPTVGYMSHSNSTPNGRLLRTIDGGNSWYVLPEGSGSIPTNSRLNRIAACTEDANTVYGGGLSTGGTDGFLVLAAG